MTPSPSAYTAYRYEPNLGENLSDIIRPGLFVLDFSPTSNEAKVSSIEPSNLDEKLGVFFKQPAAAPRLAKDGPITLYAVGSRLFADGRRRGANVSLH